MTEAPTLLTKRGFVVLRRVLLSLVLLLMLSLGLWGLNQALDSIIILGRNFVDVPGYPVQVSVWTYHDAAFALLWASYVGFVLWEVVPWRPRELTSGKIIIALLGFALLTAGLWLSQDLMNAVLVLNRTSVDLPFFIARLDLYQTRDLVIVLVSLSYITFFTLARVAKSD